MALRAARLCYSHLASSPVVTLAWCPSRVCTFKLPYQRRTLTPDVSVSLLSLDGNLDATEAHTSSEGVGRLVLPPPGLSRAPRARGECG